MIFPLAGLVIGALLGAWRAGKHGGTNADRVHWALAHGVAFAILGLFAAIVVSRLMV